MKVNSYFDGNVTSIAFENGEGRATAGVMAIGKYEFGTTEHELMKVTSGLMHVKLPGETDYKTFRSGDQFSIAAGQKFQLDVEQASSYVCFYS